jgi:preprotein translocase subunit SecG
MAILGIVLLVLFIVVSVLLVFMVLVQDEGGEGMGGIFAGSSNSTFGSRTGNVITRFTTVLGALFLILAFGLSFVHRSGGTSSVEAAAKKSAGTQTEWWNPSPSASPSDGSAPLESASPSPSTAASPSPSSEGTKN